MIKERIEKLLLTGGDRLLIFDKSDLARYYNYLSMLLDNGYSVYEYTHVEGFRITYEEFIRNSGVKMGVVVTDDIYIPYDIRKSLYTVDLSLASLFPKLNAETIAKNIRDLDLISFAYDSCYSDLSMPSQTEAFLRDTIFSKPMIERYCEAKTESIRSMCETAVRYTDWMDIAKQKAEIEYYAAKMGLATDMAFTNEAFKHFIDDGYGTLSTEVNRFFPAIVTKTLGLIGGKGEKSALIVMDGMSLFDFVVLSRYFGGIDYDYLCSYALIPTMTPISRQSLLSGKYPRELEKPFSLVNEEKEFVTAGEKLGYKKNQIQYLHGFNPDIDPFAKLVAIIVNEVDDIVHGQRQGRVGMYNDMNVLGECGKLTRLISQLAELGFSVYITADHGNTLCVGVGGYRSGVEVETRSMRMAVLKDFAEANPLLVQNAIEYPGYYLDKSYRYFVCNNGVSFDNKGEHVITHGGMSLDEVIVPFIVVREVK